MQCFVVGNPASRGDYSVVSDPRGAQPCACAVALKRRVRCVKLCGQANACRQPIKQQQHPADGRDDLRAHGDNGGQPPRPRRACQQRRDVRYARYARCADGESCRRFDHVDLRALECAWERRSTLQNSDTARFYLFVKPPASFCVSLQRRSSFIAKRPFYGVWELFY